MFSSLFLPILQTAIGSALGFLLGLWAFHYQQEQIEEKQDASKRKEALDTLSRLALAAGANIESLAILKSQYLNDLKPEAITINEMVASIYAAGDEKQRKIEVSRLLAQSPKMVHFYRALTKPSTMLAPEPREYVLLQHEMPALSLFVHRAMSFTEELSDCIASRNEAISEHARENTTAIGMPTIRMVYFASMLSDDGKAICNAADYALHCWKLTLDQIEEYVINVGDGQPFLLPTLAEKAVKQLPDENLVPGLRSQMTRFS